MIKGKMFRNVGSKIGRPSEFKPKDPKVLICTKCPFPECVKGTCERYGKEYKKLKGK